MLLIPAENGFTKKNLPWLTFILMLLNIAAYVSLQGDDEQVYSQAIDYYIEQDLLKLEQPAFEAYAKENRQSIYQQLHNEQFNELEISQLIIFDKHFAKQLNKLSSYSTEWREKRLLLNNILEQSSTLQYAFYPSEPSLFTAFAHMFMHGDFAHLFGNLIFMFLFGYNLELLIGKSRMLLTYLLSGLGGAAFFAITTDDPYIPLVGASGAISGLMGGFAGYYGLQKIRYFYWFFIIFNYIKLPAILVLAFWLLKELLFSSSDDGVAYMAHFGGLLTGALAVLLIKKWRLAPIANEQSLVAASQQDKQATTEQKQSNNEDKVLLQKASLAMKNLDFQLAKDYFYQLLDGAPNNKDYLSRLYSLEKQKPSSSLYSDLVNKILALSLKQENIQKLSQKVIIDVKHLHGDYRAIDPNILINYCKKQSLINDPKAIRQPINFLLKEYSEHPQLAETLLHFALAMEAAGDWDSKHKILTFISKKYPSTFAGQEAIKELQKDA